jgi:hypothetical protein
MATIIKKYIVQLLFDKDEFYVVLNSSKKNSFVTKLSYLLNIINQYSISIYTGLVDYFYAKYYQIFFIISKFFN